MIKTTIFTGFGNSQDSAIYNANQQADSFLNGGNGRRIEQSRTFLAFANNGTLYSATLQLAYTTNTASSGADYLTVVSTE